MGTATPKIKLAQAYEANLRAYTVAMTEAGGGFVQRDPDAVLTAFPYTYWTNRVVSPRLSLEDPLKRVNETLAIFCGLGREVCFSLGFVQTGRHPVYDYSIKKQKEDAASRD